MKQSPKVSPRSERRRKVILQTAIELVMELGFRAVSVESIAAETGVAKTTIYRRWPNKAAIVMDAFMERLLRTQFPVTERALDSVRLQMHSMARAFRSKDGAVLKALLAEAQFDPELATAIRGRWTLPRRKLALAVFQRAVSQGELRPDIDLEATIDLLYAPMYYRLQRGTAPLSDAYIDEIFDQVTEGLLQRQDRLQKDGKR
jgi:AcrR family transcriptional regulator